MLRTHHLLAPFYRMKAGNASQIPQSNRTATPVKFLPRPPVKFSTLRTHHMLTPFYRMKAGSCVNMEDRNNKRVDCVHYCGFNPSIPSLLLPSPIYPTLSCLCLSGSCVDMEESNQGVDCVHYCGFNPPIPSLLLPSPIYPTLSCLRLSCLCLSGSCVNMEESNQGVDCVHYCGFNPPMWLPVWDALTGELPP